MFKMALVHLVGLLIAAAIARLGWYMAHNPARALRFFTLGIEPAFGEKFGTAFLKILGWVFCYGMSAEVILCAILIVMDLAHGR